MNQPSSRLWGVVRLFFGEPKVIPSSGVNRPCDPLGGCRDARGSARLPEQVPPAVGAPRRCGAASFRQPHSDRSSTTISPVRYIKGPSVERFLG